MDRTSADILPSRDFISWCAENWRSLAHTDRPLTPLMTALKVAKEALRVSVLDYIQESWSLSVIPTEELKITYQIKDHFTQIIREITYSTEFHQEYVLGRYRGDAYGNLHIIWKTSQQCWLITHSHFVAVRDMFNSWFDALLYGLCHRNKYPGYDFYQEICETLLAGRELLIEWKRDAYIPFSKCGPP